MTKSTTKKNMAKAVEPAEQVDAPVHADVEPDIDQGVGDVGDNVVDAEVHVRIGEHYPANIADAKVCAVRSRTGGTFWRGGCRFGADFTVLYRADLAHDKDWMRIATEPMLEVREVDTSGIDADVPQ